MDASQTLDDILQGLNQRQREAVCHGQGPLLIVAGAGTGKTRTLVHRVAAQLQQGVDPGRMLLLTFTRRAAAEMLRRVDALVRRLDRGGGRQAARAMASQKVWGGTFHAVATRLLRMYGDRIGLDPSFTIHDRGDSEDLLDVVRTELGLARTDKRFPKKATAMAIYSRSVNSRQPLEAVLEKAYPWCRDYGDALKRLFAAYVDRKEQAGVLDYDDLLLFWHGLVADEAAGGQIRERFDCVLVDEYQDTNLLQAEILGLLKPDGRGLTVVGDDAQSIYSFRAATVRNILDFPEQFAGTTIVKLEENYRSTAPILAATNAVIAQARQRHKKELWTSRRQGQRPAVVLCDDENDQADYVVREVLRRREGGALLRQQAVLFRASHHSMVLEAELARSKVPFVKYGGLKFMETAHVKDLLAYLRLAENPRDVVAGLRALVLLPGVGPARARQWMDLLQRAAGDLQAWAAVKPPPASGPRFKQLAALLARLRALGQTELAEQVHLVRRFYEPLLEEQYDNVEPRLRDLEQMELLAGRFASRTAMLAEITLDPPATTEDFAGPPLVDEDYLILSTIHSAKGLEWDSVYVIHAADGNIPSDMATGDSEQIEEERRLFYVALTRARNWLHVCMPLRYYQVQRGPRADRYGYAKLTRFISKAVKPHFDSSVASLAPAQAGGTNEGKRQAIRQRTRAMWEGGKCEMG